MELELAYDTIKDVLEVELLLLQGYGQWQYWEQYFDSHKLMEAFF